MAVIDVPGPVADFLLELPMVEDQEAAYDGGKPMRRGRGYILRVDAPLEIHEAWLERCWVMAGGKGIESTPRERQAYRTYGQRIAEKREEENG